MFEPQTLVLSVFQLMDRFSLQGLVIAESCTGGLLSSWITQIPGSSRYFWGSVVCYHNQAKVHFLRVDPKLIEEHGAVSAPVALAMCQGLQTWPGAQCGIAITGIAGPSGGSAQKPVGLVYIGTFVNEKISVNRVMLVGGRKQIQTQAAAHGLVFLRQMLETQLVTARTDQT